MNGCGRNHNAQPINFPQAGSPQAFDVEIYNGTQWPLLLNYNGQTYTLPVGSTLDIPVGFLPQSVTVDVETFDTPPYIFPTQTKFLNKDYSPFSTFVEFDYY